MAAEDRFLDMTVVELGAAIRAGTVTPTQLVEGYMDRIGRLDPQLNAFATVTLSEALDQARQAERELASGLDRGPLHGIPYGTKDLVATAGIPTTWGSPIFADRTFDFDATVVERMRETGAVLMGKCSMIELAGGLNYETAEASLTGAALNPWDTTRWTCGSSSGSGGAVAARMLPAALGSETWGSIICPSSFCGITGLRPTYGRISRHGAMALSWTMDKLGPMARTAEDCELLLEALAGPDPHDPTAVAEPLADRITLKEAARLRVGVFHREPLEDGDPAIGEAFHGALEDLRRAGLRLEEVDLPDLPVEEAAWIIIESEAAAAFESIFDSGRIREMATPTAPLVYPASKLIRATDYLKAMRIRTAAQRGYADLLSRYDAVVSLGLLFTAVPAEGNLNDYWKGSDPMGGAGNLCGLPGLSLPCGFGSDDLPVGMVVLAGAFEERKALALGRLYQSVTDWHARKPPLVA